MKKGTIITGVICTIGGILIADRFRHIHSKSVTETFIEKVEGINKKEVIRNKDKEEKELSADEVEEKIKKFDEEIKENKEENKEKEKTE